MSSNQRVLIVSAADVVASPFPHVFKQPFVRPDLYQRLKQEFPPDEYFDQQSNLGGRAGRDLYPGDMLYDELLRTSPAWRELAEFIDSQQYVDLTLELFGPYLEQFGCLATPGRIRHTKWIESREILATGSTRMDRIKDRFRSTVGLADRGDGQDPNDVFVRMDIAQGTTGYEKPVHCDRPNRLTSMLIYFCDKDEIGMEGGDLRIHQHKRQKEISKYERHPKPEDTEIIASIEPQENLGGMFIGSNNSYHSATAVTRSDDYRRFVYTSIASRSMQLWKH